MSCCTGHRMNVQRCAHTCRARQALPAAISSWTQQEMVCAWPSSTSQGRIQSTRVALLCPWLHQLMVRDSSQTSSALNSWLFNWSFEGSPPGLGCCGHFLFSHLCPGEQNCDGAGESRCGMGSEDALSFKGTLQESCSESSVASILPEYKVCLLVAPAFVIVISSKIFLGCYSEWFYVTFHRKCCHLWQF